MHTKIDQTEIMYGSFCHAKSGEIYIHKMEVTRDYDGNLTGPIVLVGICGPVQHDDYNNTHWENYDFNENDIEWADTQSWTHLADSDQ